MRKRKSDGQGFWSGRHVRTWGQNLSHTAGREVGVGSAYLSLLSSPAVGPRPVVVRGRRGPRAQSGWWWVKASAPSRTVRWAPGCGWGQPATARASRDRCRLEAAAWWGPRLGRSGWGPAPQPVGASLDTCWVIGGWAARGPVPCRPLSLSPDGGDRPGEVGPEERVRRAREYPHAGSRIVLPTGTQCHVPLQVIGFSAAYMYVHSWYW